MDSFTQESLRIIKKASEDNKLVIVVGAGVSMLSHFPSWKEVIDRFSGPFSEQKERYSQNEYLRIPQKYYNLRGHKEYYDLLRDIFDIDLQSNRIHEEILKLNPMHLITTNYDDLIEQAVYNKGVFYDVIAKDEEVSQTRTKSFLIKMHGDIKHQNVVLKENDYLSYSTHFKLVETLVQSIIASHITLFIGYSLNDRNMKLILNWIKELQGSSFQPVYLLYLEQALDQSNFDYYKSQGIHVIDVNDLVERAQQLPYEQRYLSFFEKLNELDLDEIYRHHRIEDWLHDRLKPLEELNRVRLKDLRQLLKEVDLTETGTMHLKREALVDEAVCYQLKKANIHTINLPEGGVLQLTYETKNYLKSPYITQWSMCIADEPGIWQTYQRAYYHYKRGNLQRAYGLYKKTATEAFKSKHYLMHYLAQFNRYWIGRTMTRLFDEASVQQISDEVHQINLEILYHHLPATFKRQYAFLADLSNFYFIYKYLNDIILLMNELPQRLDALRFKAIELFDFMHGNLLVIDDYLEVSHLYKSYIEAIIFYEQQALDSFTLHLIIKYLEANELYALLERKGIKKLKTAFVADLIQLFEDYQDVLTHQQLAPRMTAQLQQMSHSLLALLSMTQLSLQSFLELAPLLFKQISSHEASLLFLRKQLPNLHPSQAIDDYLEQQVMKGMIQKYGLYEQIESPFIEFVSLMTRPSEKITQLVRLHFGRIQTEDLIELTPLLNEALKRKLSRRLSIELLQSFDFSLLYEAFKQQLAVPYDRFTHEIVNLLKEQEHHLLAVGEMIACGALTVTPFIEYTDKDECFNFLCYYAQIKTTPTQKSWIWELPISVHERLAMTFHRPFIKEALAQKIKEGDNHPVILELYFQIY